MPDRSQCVAIYGKVRSDISRSKIVGKLYDNGFFNRFDLTHDSIIMKRKKQLFIVHPRFLRYNDGLSPNMSFPSLISDGKSP